jgi:NitT/TauT family transport system substrate-binding protein
MNIRGLLRSASGIAAGLLIVGSTVLAAPLKVAYSDWPGWTAFAIAEQKGWFKQAGVEVELLWFEYGPSMEAFSAAKVDAVMVTNGDSLVTGAAGAKNVVVLVTDYSNGNDMVVARPGIDSLASLKGKKIGVEVGLVDHLLLLNGLKKAGLSEADVTLVPTPTNQAPQVLASGQVDAIAAWQPNSGAALKAVPGAKAVYTSADEPGLIYDTVAVSPQSLATRRADWAKFVSVWERIITFLSDPATHDEGVRIMAAKAGVDPKEYEAFMGGTKLLSLAQSLRILTNKADSFGSLNGSSKVADEFNVKNAVYAQPQDIPSYVDTGVTAEAMKSLK